MEKKIAELKQKSLLVRKDIGIIFPKYNLEVSLLEFEFDYLNYNNSYSTENGYLCFIDNYEMYITSNDSETRNLLDDLKFDRKEFDFPFSHGETPLENAKKKFLSIQEEAKS